MFIRLVGLRGYNKGTMLTNFWRRKSGTASDTDVTEIADAGEGTTLVEEDTAASSAAPLTAAKTTLRDRLVVTWAVPEERVRPHLPESVLPDRLPFEDGELRAFLQVEYALHESPKLARFPGITGGVVPGFYQVTYRILTRRARDGKQVPGSYDVRTFISVSELHMAKRATQRQADFARFTVFVDGDPARGTYRVVRVRAAGEGVTQIEVRGVSEEQTAPAPFATINDLTRFLDRRDEVLFRSSLPGNRIGVTPLQPAAGTDAGKMMYGSLVSARCTPWTDMKLLTAEELMAPLLITLESEKSVQALPPRLLKRPAQESA